ncbi:MAG: fructosamine kinase family protein [Gemmatimonadota bacterium]
MSVPAAVVAEVAPLLGGTVLDARPVGGGCISPAARVQGQDGRVGFLKWASGDTPAGLFAAEGHGLNALRQAGAVPVPTVLGVDGDRWLLLEWLEPAPADAAAWTAFGSGLAALHRSADGAWGWETDNFIGPLPQANAPAADWPSFWAERRLAPMLARARRTGHLSAADERRGHALLAALPDLLGPAAVRDGPSLLHGDLWSGNAHACAAGLALVDPAVYRGHREVDLAMADLFGGFPEPFWAAYAEAWPLLEGAARRRAVYQLYYLLVHVILFGGGYVARTRAALGQAGF